MKEQNLPDNMIKIERKKKMKKSAEERKRVQQEIEMLLENPQDIEGRDRAVQLIEQAGIEAKDVSSKDIRRLRRLKKKAERQETQSKERLQTQ